MVKAIDKTKIKNWLVGDTFAYKINSKKYSEYNDRYILFSVVDMPKLWNFQRPYKIMSLKITANNTLPKTQSEFEELENIKMGFEDIFDIENSFETKKCLAIPDKYDYVYRYVMKFHNKSSKLNADMLYIGNFTYNYSDDSYIPESAFDEVYLFLYSSDISKEIDNILDFYVDNNLQKGIWFTEEYLSKKDYLRKKNKLIVDYLKYLHEKIKE